ncbi:helix-turn-helix transcriptional regulator [Nocardiopsis sp. CNR-923]|uniref:helix-turn-helix domain-containing protein n=1 Tax=Nocardiopsis sp. CNR-923 TaxID=1904965 RepID=UPI002916E880|nr:helix-turn-helix transcriptional regulator [Nocardiopsis sp. CNR-923]
MASPTLRRRRLSRLLRELREGHGWTASKVAKKAKDLSGKPRGWSASKLTRLEGAEWKRVQTADVLTLLDIYGITDEQTRADYVTLAREANQQGGGQASATLSARVSSSGWSPKPPPSAPTSR